MSLLEELKNTNFPYSPTVVRDLIDSNYERYGYVRAKTKKIIFYMMKRIVLRGVTTFFNINRNRKNDVCYETDDMVNEIYMVLSNCTDKFDTRLKKDFYLYFSSSVSRRMSRMANYKKVNNSEMSFSQYATMIDNDEQLNVEEIIEDGQVGKNESEEFFEHLDNMDWTENERKVLDSLKRGRTPRDVMSETGLSQDEYEDAMDSIRMMLQYDDIFTELMYKLKQELHDSKRS